MAESIKNVFSLEELELLKASFAKADVNKDKALSLPEFKTIMASSKLVYYKTLTVQLWIYHFQVTPLYCLDDVYLRVL